MNEDAGKWGRKVQSEKQRSGEAPVNSKHVSEIVKHSEQKGWKRGSNAGWLTGPLRENHEQGLLFSRLHKKLPQRDRQRTDEAFLLLKRKCPSRAQCFSLYCFIFFFLFLLQHFELLPMRFSQHCTFFFATGSGQPFIETAELSRLWRRAEVTQGSRRARTGRTAPTRRSVCPCHCTSSAFRPILSWHMKTLLFSLAAFLFIYLFYIFYIKAAFIMSKRSHHECQWHDWQS